MKMTFTKTDKPTYASCDDCGQQIAGTWWYNWRKKASVRFLCDCCHSIREDKVVSNALGLPAVEFSASPVPLLPRKTNA